MTPRDIATPQKLADTPIQVHEPTEFIQGTSLEQAVEVGKETIAPTGKVMADAVTKGEAPTLEKLVSANQGNPLMELLPDLSVGFILGYATATALRMVGRMALVVVGLGFLLVQYLAAQGIVTVDWLRLETLTKPIEQNGGPWLNQLWNSLVADLPFAGSFGTGFMLGLR